jgi:hypothetical protein
MEMFCHVSAQLKHSSSISVQPRVVIDELRGKHPCQSPHPFLFLHVNKPVLVIIPAHDDIRQDHMYEQPVAPYPGPNPNYGQPYYPPEQPILYDGDSKDPYEGGRFKPKKTINDPIFLILFILQVKLRRAFRPLFSLLSRIRCRK